MSKDHHDSTLQESLQKREQQQEEEEEGKEEQGLEKDGGGGGGGEEAVASRKDVEEECKTPTSSDHKIPTIQSCPPTPKKKVGPNSRKRKLSELQFFETTRSEEVESFFRSKSEPSTVNSRSIKRRCRSA
ncbi:cyclin-dependent protein kinase inhibitor SMR2 [Herrania umbratica]|uniref:Cyclin-dependent protein kinase inhibitor SMR2 n=1 Tax=Herrania umbratica TaxID=108875 RepID=A0A6J0ZVS5_9ROSI|nr:cyclin-dependent protein kinase inhibitor SMR2 [Herrania umbratica]